MRNFWYLLNLWMLTGSPLVAGELVKPSARFEPATGDPQKVVWRTEPGLYYDFMISTTLANWFRAAGFPRLATGESMESAISPLPGGNGFYRVVVAEKSPLLDYQDGFVLIPAGGFQMGNSFPAEAATSELPVHTVILSPFHMAKHEVTKGLWDEVRAWGISRGYTDLPTGSSAGGTSYSKGRLHPVHLVTWYDVVKWCNAWSEKEGLAPCYRVNGEVYRAGSQDGVTCDWAANGYRLPTEAEWEKAARGGLNGARYPWGDTIGQDQANYYSSGGSYGNLSGNTGYHPAFNDGLEPYTAQVGSFAPNGYGLHDMAGNVWEWCWDWRVNYVAGTQVDPRGPTRGRERVRRGGYWGYYGGAVSCRVAYRYDYNPGESTGAMGFRVARSSVSGAP